MITVPPKIVQFNVIIILILIFGYVIFKRLLFSVSQKVNKLAYYTENYSDIMGHLVLPQGLCTTRTKKNKNRNVCTKFSGNKHDVSEKT